MSHTQESEAGCAEKMLEMFSALIFELMADISDPLEEELRPDRSIFSPLLLSLSPAWASLMMFSTIPV